MKKLKFKIGRKRLSKLYIVFIRPTLEYASIVWDGCFANDIEKLEKVQLSAARIVTGLPIFASREYLYTEIITMFKIYNGYALPYLNDIIPDKHENVSLSLIHI